MGLLEEQTRRRVGEEVVFPLVEAESAEMDEKKISYKQRRKQSIGMEASSVDGDRANIALLLFLYTLQGIPLGLASALPMVLQNKGVNYKDQAMFSLVQWPFSLKLLWAPIVDALFMERFGRRKTWLIPSQYLIGFSMLVLSYRVDHWVRDPTGPHTVLLTILFFLLNFLAATQDIAVDGWALTMLKRANVGYASTCNSVGQTTGYFLGYVVFMALESADFCNRYIRWEPQPEGLIPLPSFLSYCGIVFLVSTTLIGLLKHETPPRPDDEPSPDILGTYRLLLRIIRLPSVRDIALVMLTCKVSFSACDAVTGLKLVESGVPKEQFAIVALFMAPLQLVLPVLLSRYLISQRPMDVFNRAYPYRLCFNLIIAVLVLITPHVIVNSEIPTYYYILLILIYGTHQMAVYSMFVAQMAFYARVSDPAVGGTYMTLLNTVSNLGGSWPNSLILMFVDVFTFKSCSNSSNNTCSTASLVEQCTSGEGHCRTWLDGYYLLTIMCTLYGFLWFSWGRRKVNDLQRRDMADWQISRSHRGR